MSWNKVTWTIQSTLIKKDVIQQTTKEKLSQLILFKDLKKDQQVFNKEWLTIKVYIAKIIKNNNFLIAKC